MLKREARGSMLKRGTKTQIKVSSAKGKARNFQKEIAGKIGTLLNRIDDVGYEEDKLIQPAVMGQGGVDVKIDQSIRPLFPYAIECKNTERWDIPKTIKQARAYVKKEYKHWIVFLRKKEFKKSFAVIETDLLFELLQRAQTNEKRGSSRNKKSPTRVKK